MSLAAAAKTKKSSETTTLKRNQFSSKTNRSKGSTQDKSIDSDCADATKRADAVLAVEQHKESAFKPVEADPHEKASKSGRVNLFRDFAGVTIVLKAATSSKHGAHDDSHSKASANHPPPQADDHLAPTDI